MLYVYTFLKLGWERRRSLFVRCTIKGIRVGSGCVCDALLLLLLLLVLPVMVGANDTTAKDLASKGSVVEFFNVYTPVTTFAF